MAAADLTNTAAVKAYAGVQSSGDDSAIGGIVSAVSALFHAWIGHDFDGTPIVGEAHEPPASGVILLRKPAASISAVREGGATLSGSAYRFTSTRMLARLAAGRPSPWLDAVQVDYTPISTVPKDLEIAAREACAWIVKQSSLSTGGARLGLSAQSNADTGNADYLIQRIDRLPLTRAVIARYALGTGL